MSFLDALISSKKSQLSNDKKRIGKKWVRRGDIKKLREKEQEEKVKRLKRERQAEKVLRNCFTRLYANRLTV